MGAVSTRMEAPQVVPSFTHRQRDESNRQGTVGSHLRPLWLLQSSFLFACKEWLGRRTPDGLALVRKGKRQRGEFRPKTSRSYASTTRLNSGLMVRLAIELKRSFDSAKIPLSQFYGAGAAATAFLTQIGARAFIDRFQPPEVERVARHGYFGGRIEVPIYGEIPGPITRYDMHSAYPSAIAELPNLTRGKWVHDKEFRPELSFSIYHVAWKLPKGRPFYPFAWRSPEGAIYFPPTGRAWIWHPEVAAALQLGGFPKRAIRLLEAWHFIPDDPAERPFAVVAEKVPAPAQAQGGRRPGRAGHQALP